MNWTNIWMTLFGTTDLLGLNMGFWISMVVVAMNVVFWARKPQKRTDR